MFPPRRSGFLLEGALLYFFLGLLAVSGAALLGVQVVWARALHRLLGSTALSVAAVIAGFLGGLGLGAWLAERVLPRIQRPFGAYAVCQLGCAATAFLLPTLAPLFEETLSLPAGEILVLAAVVCLSAPWGAAFPFVVEAFRRHSRHELLPSRIRWAYGINALGSAAGGLLAGLFGIPWAGEWAVLGASAICAGAGGLCAAWLAVLEGPLIASPEARGPTASAGTLTFLFASGLVVIYWEVLWTRILALVVGATNYSFSAAASGVVAGIGIGSLLFGGRLLARHAGWILPSAAALALAAGYAAVPSLPLAYLYGVRSLGLPPLLAGAAGAGAIVFLPNFMLGSLVPWAISRCTGSAGKAYAANCAGCACGAVLGGPIAATALGLEDAYRVGVSGLALLATLGAPFFLRPRDGRGLRLGLGLGSGLAASCVLFLALGAGPLGNAWAPKHVLSGVYQWSIEDLKTLPFDRMLAAREILLLEAGREVTVTVELDHEANTVYFRGNGKVEGSVPADASLPSRADMPTQLLLGALPSWFLSQERRPSVLLVGLGSGVTLGALLRSGSFSPLGSADALAPPPSRVDVIEVEGAYLSAIRRQEAREYLEAYIPPWILGAAGDGQAEAFPARIPCEFHIGDARRVLAVELRRRHWDAIVSQPSEPWIPAASGLFTREFFELASRRLSPEGVFVQWLQLYKLDLESIRLLVRTFRRTFPLVFLLRPPDTGELLLVGSFRRPDLERLLGGPLEPWLSPARLEMPADRLAIFVCGPEGVDEWVGLSPDLPVNTDSRSDLSYRAARALYASREALRENVEALRRLGASDPISKYLRLEASAAQRLEERIRFFARR